LNIFRCGVHTQQNAKKYYLPLRSVLSVLFISFVINKIY
jgi:hypothetical protein